MPRGQPPPATCTPPSTSRARAAAAGSSSRTQQRRRSAFVWLTAHVGDSAFDQLTASEGSGAYDQPIALVGSSAFDQLTARAFHPSPRARARRGPRLLRERRHSITRGTSMTDRISTLAQPGSAPCTHWKVPSSRAPIRNVARRWHREIWVIELGSRAAPCTKSRCVLAQGASLSSHNHLCIVMHIVPRLSSR